VIRRLFRRPVFVIVALAIVAAACASTAVVINNNSSSRVDDPGLSLPSATTVTTAPHFARHPSVSTTTEPLPQPQAPPSDPYAPVNLTQIGTITIPKIGLVHPIFEGITLTVIDHGPGHWPGSAMPGHRGNTVFPGHRVTHTHPFLNLDQLSPGDAVIFRTADGTFTYQVTSIQIVKPTDMWVTDPTPTPTFTLIACHPKHSAAQRIVVKGKLVSSQPSGGVVAGVQNAAQRAQQLGI
jgi:sortase A